MCVHQSNYKAQSRCHPMLTNPQYAITINPEQYPLNPITFPTPKPEQIDF